jgi:hypothetical protein
MDAMVTARVPVEIKKRAHKVLERHGSTASEQINHLFDYLSTTGTLPDLDIRQGRRREPGPIESGPRKLIFEDLIPEQRENLSALKRLREFKANLDWGEDADRPTEELLREARDERFKTFL